MNIIVCVKQVPGTNKVAVDPKTGVLIRDGVDSKINPYDLYALEAAFALKEEKGGTVKALSMGPPQAREVLKEAIWMGADEGALLSDRKFGGADVAATSMALSLGVSKLGDFDLILCGKQTTDGDTAQVGPSLAERLGIEHLANVREILAVDKTGVTVRLELGYAIQTAYVAFPCLITMENDVNTPRLPSYNRKKAMDCDSLIRVYSVADFPQADENTLGLKGSPARVERIFPPEKETEQRLFTGTGQELAEDVYILLQQGKFL